MIEKWESTFDAVRHRHPVSLGAQEVRGQQHRELEERRSVDRRPFHEAAWQCLAQLGEWIGARELDASLRRVEILDPRREQEARHVREQRIRRSRGGEKGVAPELSRATALREVRIQAIEESRAHPGVRLAQAEEPN